MSGGLRSSKLVILISIQIQAWICKQKQYWELTDDLHWCVFRNSWLTWDSGALLLGGFASTYLIALKR